jgi:hypothetical protein
VLKVKNVEHEVMQTDFGGPVFTSAEFLALNPNGLIPVLKDGDFSMFEGYVRVSHTHSHQRENTDHRMACVWTRLSGL